MPGRTFLDTNVLVYAVDNADPAKKQTARTRDGRAVMKVACARGH